MSKKYLLANVISKINNAQKVKKQYVIIEYSNLVFNVLQTIEKLGYITKIIKIKNKNSILKIKIKLKYEGKYYHSVIKEFYIISKPGKRIFLSYKKIEKVYEGLGNKIISSPKGIITDYYAINNKIGGEILCNIV